VHNKPINDHNYDSLSLTRIAYAGNMHILPNYAYFPHILRKFSAIN